MKAAFLRPSLIFSILLAITCLLAAPFAAAGAQAVYVQTTDETEEPPTQEAQEPTNPPSPDRPLIVIKSYYLDKDTISPNESFLLFLDIKNEGGLTAHNLIFSFGGEDFLPRETGGVLALGSMGSGDTRDISQPMLGSTNLWGKTSGIIPVQLNYNGPNGEVFNESFVITLRVAGWSGVSSTATPTPTGTALPRAQLMVSGYQTDVDPLQPGSMFTLDLDIVNLGDGDAKAVTVVLGGGASPSFAETPQPGGVSGAGADLSIFAPIGSSNLLYLGDLSVGEATKATHRLIVNVSANPGAYTLKLSFVYTDSKGNRQVDDQIITLLVYQMPQLEVNFYRDPGPITAMQPNQLPIQVVNLGRKSAIMGNMTVSAEGADLMNNVSLVGTLEAGGYFPLDVMLIPQAGGPLDLTVTITYTDDFNQARSVVQKISLDVMEGFNGEPGMGPGMEGPGLEPGMGPGMDGVSGEMPLGNETFWQKALRFLKGLIGLDSAPPQPGAPVEGFPDGFPGDEPQPAPVRPGGKG
jgi:hypothetical protein